MYLGPVEEVELETREASPAHSLIKIDSFSLLEKRGISKIETKEFSAGKYKWRLVIYPNGHVTAKDEENYVSIYLAIAGTDDLPSKWEVNATFSICLFNHFSGNFRYSLGRARRFHALKTEWGFEKFVTTKIFTDSSNGYVVDDKCLFGAEVFVNENNAVTQCLSVKKIDTYSYKQEFKMTNFSTLEEKWVSEEFTVGSDTWRIEVYPDGCGVDTGRGRSLYLRKVVWNNCASSESVRPCFILRIKNQLHDRGHHQRTSPGGWLSAPNTTNAWEWESFTELSFLKDPNKGFIVNDCCVIEVEFTPQAISF